MSHQLGSYLSLTICVVSRRRSSISIMPLLNKQKFVKKQPPDDLNLDEEIFYSKLTNEIFRDYDEYFERTILCNSLVWTCNLTGRTGLTYAEALESEEKALKALGAFPRCLQRTIVHLITLSKRGKYVFTASFASIRL